MKNKILTAIAVMASLCGYAQTKGTNTLSFGVGSQTSKYDYQGQSPSARESKSTNFSVGYGLFIKDNAKLGIDLSYGSGNNKYDDNVSGSKSNSYGAGINYQYYYPLIKTLYAYAGGRVSYGYYKIDMENVESEDIITNNYSVGAFGGLTWFLSKRFALETSLLSLGANYQKDKRESSPSNTGFEVTNSSFNLSTNGVIDNLGFKVYLLF